MTRTDRLCRKWLLILPGFLIALHAPFPAAGEATDAESLFHKRCGICHKLPDPADLAPENWQKQLDKMAPLARLKKKQKGEILDFLVSHSRQQVLEQTARNDRELVRQKCSTCHTLGRVALESFTGETGSHILERMQRYAGTDYLSDEDLIQIRDYLQHKQASDLEDVPSVPPSASTEETFRTRCTGCHSLERVLQLVGRHNTSDAAWVHIVSRMREKAPDWISEEESERLARYIQSLEHDTARE